MDKDRICIWIRIGAKISIGIWIRTNIKIWIWITTHYCDGVDVDLEMKTDECIWIRKCGGIRIRLWRYGKRYRIRYGEG